MHITITGRLGSGKSTVAKIMSGSRKYEIYSTGAIQRDMAAKLGVSTLEMNLRMAADHSFDFAIDNATREISLSRAAETIIFDSRMAWNFAVKSFKVYLYVDTAVAAARVMKDDRGSVESYSGMDDAIAQLNARMKEENRRYLELYSVNNFDFNNYDLVINTEHISAEEVACIVLREFDAFCVGPTAYPSPRKYFMN